MDMTDYYNLETLTKYCGVRSKQRTTFELDEVLGCMHKKKRKKKQGPICD